MYNEIKKTIYSNMSLNINRTATPAFAFIKTSNPVIHIFEMILFFL